MKKITLLSLIACTAALAITPAVTSCSGKVSGDIETSLTEYADSTDMLYYSLRVELPRPEEAIAKEIGDGLLRQLEEDMMAIHSYDKPLFEAFSGDKSDRKAYLDYLNTECFRELDRITREEKNDALEYGQEANPWGCQISLTSLGQSDSYMVFKLTESLYYGGAHGGISGKGAMTFSKKSGKLMTDMIDRSRLPELQPILISGLNRYFQSVQEQMGEDYDLFELLFVSDGIIPLPKMPPYPSEDGLTFIYEEYEIAPYAAGMPEFTVALDEIRPFLTQEANEIL